MKLAVIGTGYVGLVSGVCFAELGNHVICVDKDHAKVELLKSGIVPIYEPGLKELMDSNTKIGRLSFTSELDQSVQESDVIILAVGTPSLPSGEADLQYIEQAARDISSALNGFKTIMTKSTVPVGTNEKIKAIIRSQTDHEFEIVSVPEFLREGSAVRDTFHPDRIVIGIERKEAAANIVELHRPLTENIIVTDIRSAEMIKYASNAFLATKISFINEIANICEKVGADVTKVAEGMGYDKRIGASFLNAGIGYGGSCFPKDTQALIQIAGNVDYDFKLLKSVVDVNNGQRFNIIHKLESILDDLYGKTIAIWGLAFKPDTDDVRAAPAFDIINSLLKRGALVRAYDPVATENFKQSIQHDNLYYSKTAEDAARQADALCIVTEWREFRQLSLQEIRSWLKTPNLIDGRNIYTEEELLNTDFVYYSVGRPKLNNGVREGAPILL
ncbi:UDP-glucose dehydrogenase family protein [Paenibacillus sp. GCM10012307]|uniref:UDP-glucose 6-dehydrogenase n=1 Tax=Paenibacillus roseus TaxID=2798579 RepID=A0A934IYZ2_9BACL|nr:UDP-glucose/GDP-mannose dehydrogenase family protein [Paenibacillus roseus]MBJ6360254.1 UDP-glucose/GDP-mannose dehydrogenase family protein [Paenibacillus roseus]